MKKIDLQNAINNNDFHLLVTPRSDDPEIDGKELSYALYYACRNGKLDAAKFLIEKKDIDPNTMLYFEGNEGPALKFAAESGNLELVAYLIEFHRVDIEAKGTHPGTQDTALMRAARNGHYAVAEYLLEHGANPNPADKDFSPLIEVIMGTADISTMILLLNSGAEIGDLDLHFAIKKGHLDIVELLIANGAAIKKPHYIPYTQLAAKSGNVELLVYLQNKQELNILSTAHISDKLLSYTTEEGMSEYQMLAAAAKSGSKDMMKYLIETCQLDIFNHVKRENKAVNKDTKNDSTILGNAFQSNSINLIKYLFEDLELKPKNQILKLLVNLANGKIKFQTYIYLNSYLPHSIEEKMFLLQISKDGLKDINLEQLFHLMYSDLGKYYTDHIRDEIESRHPTITMVSNICLSYPDLLINILFYYVDYRFNNNCSMLSKLLDAHPSYVNMTDKNGMSLIEYAFHSGGYNNIIRYLIDCGAAIPEHLRKYFLDFNGSKIFNLSDLNEPNNIEKFKFICSSILGGRRERPGNLQLLLCGSKLNHDQVTRLGKMIATKNTIKDNDSLTLDLRRCDLDDVAVTILAAAIPLSSLTELTLILNANNFGFVGIKSLADAISTGKTPPKLHIELCVNNLGLDSAVVMAGALSNVNPEKVKIDLSCNFILVANQAYEILKPQIMRGCVRWHTSLLAKNDELGIPAAFFCILSDRIMKEPVICLLDSITYEKSIIIDWLKHYRKSPLTRKKIENNQKIEDLLVINRQLNDAINILTNDNEMKRTVPLLHEIYGHSTSPSFFQPANKKQLISDISESIYICCPLSLDKLEDPVLLTVDGYTYEREWIINALKITPKSPLNQKLVKMPVNSGLIDNKNMQALIQYLNVKEKIIDEDPNAEKKTFGK